MINILMIIIGVLAVVSMIAFLVHLFVKAINKDQQEQDERILQLEKRINDIKKDLTWQIQWETKIRSDFERQVNDEILRLKRQIKKKGGNNDNS